MNRRSFIKGLTAVASALGLGLPESLDEQSDWETIASIDLLDKRRLVTLDGSSTSHQGTGAYDWTTPSRPCSAPGWYEECIQCPYDNCSDYCLNDELDDEYLLHLQEQMGRAARQETEREFEVWKFQSEVTTVGALNIDAWGEEPLGGLKWCESPPIYVLQPDGTIERMEG